MTEEDRFNAAAKFAKAKAEEALLRPNDMPTQLKAVLAITSANSAGLVLAATMVEDMSSRLAAVERKVNQ